MPSPRKIRAALMNHAKDRGPPLADVVNDLVSQGWTHRLVGSHPLLTLDRVKAPAHLQSARDGNVKDCQIRQLRKILPARGLSPSPPEP
jgi:hypothetical protein